MLAQLQAAYPDQVRIVYRHFPLNIHDKALITAQAAEAAGLQGKFWEMHDFIFAQQSTWSAMTVEEFQSWIVQQAGSLGLDAQQFETDLTSPAIVEKVAYAQSHGEEIGMTSTPFLLVNGSIWSGPNDYYYLDSLTRVILLEDRQFLTCPEMTIDPAKQYIATLETEKGDIVIQLYPDKAPLTVNSFVFLARQGWFDGVTFHRVVTDPNIAQAGDPTGTGWAGPGYYFRDEISDLKFDQPGVVGMANSGANTNGSQFFIAREALPHLDGSYTIFGQVIEGMDVVNALTPRDPSTQEIDLPEGDKILSVTIEER